MKTKQIRTNRISILFSITAILLFPFIGKAQIDLDINNNVGINNSSPTEKLDVTGNIRFSGALKPNNTSGSSGQVLTSQGSGTPTWTTPTANPGVSAGLTAVNGSAITFMRSDAAPAISQSIAPTWTGTHTFSCSSTYSALFTGGNVGIGTTTPAEKLEVDGNLNLKTATNALKINGGKIVWHNGTTSDIFVGYGAGNSSMSGHYNTFLGYGAGNANTSGAYNVANGYGSLTANTTASNNTANGFKSLYNNTSGDNNTASGSMSLYLNTTGYSNVANGIYALYSNTSGYFNVAGGKNALYSNTTGHVNTAMGYQALNTNTTGSNNVANGANALYSNATGNDNTAVGVNTLYNNTASDNTANGYQALYYNTTGNYNTALGNAAGNANTTGDHNTFVGYGADASATNLTNATAIGNGTIVSSSNSVRLGKSTVTVVEGPVAYTTYSDGRFKTDVTENVKGLTFINKLRPVTYKIDTKSLDDLLVQNLPDSAKTEHQAGMDFAPSKAIIHSGFIAQEVEQAAQQVGFASSIVHTPANNTDPYALAYAEIVVPLVKAVQELSQRFDSLQTITTKLDSTNNAKDAKLQAMQDQITQMNELINSCCNNHPAKMGENNLLLQSSVNKTDVKLSSKNIVVLDQNSPNPFAEQTSITYFLPEDVNKAQMLFYNAGGKLIQAVELTQNGHGQLTVFASDLTNGIYTYTLVVDGKIIETKKMMKQ